MNNQQIQEMIATPKRITKKDPATKYKIDNIQRRCDLELESSQSGSNKFTAFIRQNNFFIENFSIGLRFLTDDPNLGSITLIRYNGPHGDSAIHPDGHYAKPHIHRITAEEISSGSRQPKEKHREITNLYNTLEQALRVFFDDIAVENYTSYFPEIQQGRFPFNGNQ